ncbi:MULTISPECIES: hypothetical protein [Brucella]|uniref:hypothetical protein n=1 Tax=Brucella TaxID=234 RepID=UPI00178C592F|nr:MULTISPECIES: hypothetical protein [Brucella]MCB4920032.1 hypothetical protein [Brucella intermedia]
MLEPEGSGQDASDAQPRTYQNEVLVGQELKELFVSRLGFPEKKKPNKPKSRRRWPK